MISRKDLIQIFKKIGAVLEILIPVLRWISLVILIGLPYLLMSQNNADYTLTSPDGKLVIHVSTKGLLTWSVAKDNDNFLKPSPISIQLSTGEVLGRGLEVKDVRKSKQNLTFHPVAYKKSTITDHYNELKIDFKGEYGVEFRAYNEGVAYRFFTNRKEDLIIKSEDAAFNFDKDYIAWVPQIEDVRGGDPYSCSFESFYTQAPLSAIPNKTYSYVPLLVKLEGNRKVVLLEADVQDFPGMLLLPEGKGKTALKITHAPRALEEELGGLNRINVMVKKRADHIAQVKGNRTFPWRVMVVSEDDKELLNNDMVQKLAEPSRIQDPSWIRPGKVAWDWWNDWNLTDVDFKPGVNTRTYKHYIDFAAANHLEYVILDEGWSDDWDLNKVNPEIELKELIDYGKQKNVGLILWSTWYAARQNTDELFEKFSQMGIKGFKVDFIDRDDQFAMSSLYELARLAAKHHLMLDYHGVFKPQGLQRTWPNVVNFEGVRGMEYSKWSADDKVPEHELSIPFIRMVAGPMDYTPGAMRNNIRGEAKPSNSDPVSQGTRCHQMAMFVMYEAPLQMLADNPSIYRKEQECTDFIAAIPTTYDETVALMGELGKYAVIARRKGSVWYLAGMTNWEERKFILSLDFLGKGNHTLEIFRDGDNANQKATAYVREKKVLGEQRKLVIPAASGGGFVIRIQPQ